MAREHGLTTIDNPWDRNSQFDRWFLWDVNHGWNTLDLEIQEANLVENMTPDEEDDAIEAGIDRIMANDLLNLYRRIKLDDE